MSHTKISTKITLFLHYFSLWNICGVRAQCGRSSSIEVRVLPDRIEILSHPGADRSISLEGLRNYHVFSRRYRNRRIGDFLKEMHLTEGRNTGFQKILEALNFNGSLKSLFETDEERTYFAAALYIHPDAISATLGGNGGNSESETDDHQKELKGNALQVT